MHVCPECGDSFPDVGFCPGDGNQLRDQGDDLVLGTTIGQFRIAGLLGVGGMGRVYKGVNPKIRSRVAIKVLSESCVHKRELVERFFAEARAVNLIRHESIVNVLDLAELPDGRPYIVMEYLDGHPLSSYVARGPMPLGTLAQLMSEVLGALDAAHNKSIVHRDLKPDNVFVTPQGRAKVLDFGIAKLRPEHSGRDSTTRDGQLLGTPHYMAPEQCQGLSVDARVDIYAAGAILFEAATGVKPFLADSLFELLRMQIEQAPTPPRTLRSEMPPAYEQVILRALAKAPDQRWQTAEQLAGALSAAAQQLPANAWAPVGSAAETGRVFSAIPTPNSGASGSDLHGEAATVRDPGAPTVKDPTHAAPVHTPPPATRRSNAVWFALVAAACAAGGAGAAVWYAGRDRDVSADVEPAQAGAGAAVTAAAAGSSPGTEPGTDASAAETETEAPAVEAPPTAATPSTPTTAEAATPTTPAAAKPVPVVDAGAGLPADAPSLRTSRKNPTPAAWDVSAQLRAATGAARRAFPDARFLRLDANGVQPSGTADLTLDPGFNVLYRFVSPSRARRPASLPAGVPFKPTCMYYVLVNARTVTGYPLEGWECNAPPLSPPRCRVAQVWKRAAAKGAPASNAVASIGFWSGPGDTGRWYFQLGTKHSFFVPDDC